MSSRADIRAGRNPSRTVYRDNQPPPATKSKRSGSSMLWQCSACIAWLALLALTLGLTIPLWITPTQKSISGTWELEEAHRTVTSRNSNGFYDYGLLTDQSFESNLPWFGQCTTTSTSSECSGGTTKGHVTEPSDHGFRIIIYGGIVGDDPPVTISSSEDSVSATTPSDLVVDCAFSNHQKTQFTCFIPQTAPMNKGVTRYDDDSTYDSTLDDVIGYIPTYVSGFYDGDTVTFSQLEFTPPVNPLTPTMQLVSGASLVKSSYFKWKRVS